MKVGPAMSGARDEATSNLQKHWPNLKQEFGTCFAFPIVDVQIRTIPSGAAWQ
jgi:hypothetical protein